jgi:quercetin dioxygenase-like cupin family protein
MRKARNLALGVIFAAVSATCIAQTVGVARTEVLKSAISIPDHDAIVSRVDIAPKGQLALHTHPGDEIAYVNSGVITVLEAGEPDHKVAAGASFIIKEGTIHGVKNEGDIPVQLITVHIVTKGKPLATPAAVSAK